MWLRWTSDLTYLMQLYCFCIQNLNIIRLHHITRDIKMLSGISTSQKNTWKQNESTGVHDDCWAALENYDLNEENLASPAIFHTSILMTV